MGFQHMTLSRHKANQLARATQRRSDIEDYAEQAATAFLDHICSECPQAATGLFCDQVERLKRIAEINASTLTDEEVQQFKHRSSLYVNAIALMWQAATQAAEEAHGSVEKSQALEAVAMLMRRVGRYCELGQALDGKPDAKAAPIYRMLFKRSLGPGAEATIGDCIRLAEIKPKAGKL